jgi:hypothetical protein
MQPEESLFFNRFIALHFARDYKRWILHFFFFFYFICSSVSINRLSCTFAFFRYWNALNITIFIGHIYIFAEKHFRYGTFSLYIRHYRNYFLKNANYICIFLIVLWYSLCIYHYQLQVNDENWWYPLNYGLLNRNLDTGTFYNDYYSEISDILFYMQTTTY